MNERSSRFARELRRELEVRSRHWAQGRARIESYGNPPVIVFQPEPPTEEALSLGTTAEYGRHGNFFDPAYKAIAGRPEWMRRFDKIHAQGRALPKAESGRRWRELDSSMSSDALLMNVFCTPDVAEAAAVRRSLGVDGETLPLFGWKARVPLKTGRLDRTEVDMRWGSLLAEAKLTEGDFQTCKASAAEGYRDFDEVFHRDLLPHVVLRTARKRTAIEFAEEFTQEWEETAINEEVAREFHEEIVTRARESERGDIGYAGYQLIRNVLAAHAEGRSFCVIHDERRPDLREAWFQVMAAVKSAEMRVRLKVITWQELAALLPEPLQEFLDLKYGIVRPGKIGARIYETDRSGN
jgi:hypothetical protein